MDEGIYAATVAALWLLGYQAVSDPLRVVIPTGFEPVTLRLGI